MMLSFSLWEDLDRRLKRFPLFYKADLSKVFVQVLANLPGNFSSIPRSYVTRLVCLQYYLRKVLLQKIETAVPRSVVVKAFKSSREKKTVLSIAFGVSSLHSYDLLEEKHIFKAISSFLPGLKIVPGSFYSCKEKELSCLFCYLEIEKLRGANITSLEVDLCRKKLPNELKQSVESLSPSLSVPYNEEEIYKSLVLLSKEQGGPNDLPQVMISFQAQMQKFLRFSIVAVRVKKKHSIAFEHLVDCLPSLVRLVDQRKMSLGMVGKRHQKEGLIFLLEVDHDLFLKKNWSVDLRLARNYIVKVVEKVLGAFRDYNGGMFLQQNKQFEHIIVKFREKYAAFHPLFEEIFYSFSPPLFQALIPARTCVRAFALFVRMLKKEIPEENFCIGRQKDQRSSVMIVKAATAQLQELFLREIQKVESSNYSCFGYNSLEFEGIYYLFLIDLNPSLQLLEACEQRIREKNIQPQREKVTKSLRLNFQEGDPNSLNPHVGVDKRCRSLSRALFEGLTRLDEKEIPQPAAAKEILISACQTVYTFILREHHWSNGELVTAYDFEQSWKKALGAFSTSLRADFFYAIKNARKAKQGKLSLEEVKIKAVNAKEFVVELEYPTPYFLHLTAHPALFPLYKAEEEPTQFNGPFLVQQWKKGKLLHLTSNPYYWDKENLSVEDIYISMIKDSKTIYQEFINRKLDWVGSPYSTLPQEFYCDGQQWHSQEVDRAWWIYLNTLSFPLQSASIRKAFACAINRNHIVRSIGQHPLVSPIPDTQCKEYIDWDGNAAQASLFFDAGLKELNLSRASFPELTFCYSDIPGHEYLAKMVQAQINDTLKIKMKLIRVPWNNLSLLLDRKDYQLAGCLRSSPYFYPRSHLELFRDRSNLYNASQWGNSTYTSLLKQARSISNFEKRDCLLKEAEQILIEHMPVIGVFRQVYRYYLNPRIKKVVIAQNGDVDFKLVSI